MAKEVLSNLDLCQNEIQNVVIQRLASAPTNPVIGQIYFNTVNKIMYQCVEVTPDVVWTAVGDCVIKVIEVNGVVVPVVDHVVDITVPTDVSDLTDEDNMYVNTAGDTMSGNLNMGSHKLTNVDTPTADGDAATKAYVDDSIEAMGHFMEFKGSVATYSALPTTNVKIGDVWLVTADNTEYIAKTASAQGVLPTWEQFGKVFPTMLEKTGTIAVGSTSVTITELGNNATICDICVLDVNGAEVITDIVRGTGSVTVTLAKAATEAYTVKVHYFS